MPAGELLAFTADSHYGQLLSGAGPQRFGILDQAVMDRIRPGGRQVLARHRSFLAVPMTARGSVVTFDQHPAAVVRPESAPLLLTDLEQKLELTVVRAATRPD